LGATYWLESWHHREASGREIAPPSCLPGRERTTNELVSDNHSKRKRLVLWFLDIIPFFVNEQSANTPRSRIEVFVSAPDGEVDAPIVQVEWHVAYRMGKIPAAFTSLEDIFRFQPRTLQNEDEDAQKI
jgi:hypothetical protein